MITVRQLNRRPRHAVLFASMSIAATIAAIAPPLHAEAPREAVSVAVLMPLQAVPELIKTRKFEEALGKLREADAVANKSAYDVYVIDQMRASAAAGAGDNLLAAKSYQAVMASGRLPVAETLPIMDVVARMYYNAKDFKQAAAWAARFLKDGGVNPQTRLIMLRALHFGGDYQTAKQEITADIRRAEQAGQAPPLELLQLLASCAQKLDDQPAYMETLEKLVAYYPRPEYWKDLIFRVATKPTFSSSLHLNMSRLRYSLGQFSDAADYMDLAERAIRAGFPIEAKQVLDQGFARGLLGTGSDAARHQKLRDATAKDAADELKDFPRAEATAAKSADGTGLIGVGFNYVINGQADKGVTLMEQGLRKGGLKRPEEATLRLGMAYVMAGQKQKAVETLKTVQGADGTADLARLWALYASQPALPTTDAVATINTSALGNDHVRRAD